MICGVHQDITFGGARLSEKRFDKDRLVALMKARGIGDTELAEAAGVSRTMIFYLKKGRRQSASAEVMTRIADALNTTVDYLLGENGDRQPPMQKLPEPIRQLAEVAGRLSEVRQEELLHIAAALEKLEREQSEHPIPSGSMRVLLELAEQLRERGGNEDLLSLLESLFRNSPRRRGVDLGSEQSPDNPSKGD